MLTFAPSFASSDFRAGAEEARSIHSIERIKRHNTGTSVMESVEKQSQRLNDLELHLLGVAEMLEVDWRKSPTGTEGLDIRA